MSDHPTASTADQVRVLVDRAARHLAPAEGEQLRTLTRQFVAGRETWRAKAEEIERDRDRLRDELAQTTGTDGYGTPVHWTVYNGMHRRALNGEAERDRARATAVALENECTRQADELTAHENAPVLRNRLVPGCLREFDIAAWMDSHRPLKRPEWSGEGWRQIRPAMPLASGHVCPGHAELVAAHLPQRHDPVPPGMVQAACSCREWMSPLARWHGAVRGLWEDHLLLELDDSTEPRKDDEGSDQ